MTMSDVEDSDKSNSTSGENLSLSHKKVKEHVNQLQRLRGKDPEFYAFLTEHDKDLLEFKDEDAKEDSEVVESQLTEDNVQKPSGKVITTAMVDSWCVSIKGNGNLGSVRSLLRAFRTACHYGDDLGTDAESRYSIVSSSVFNKIMVFVLNEMDGILRALLHAPSFGGKKETIMDLMTTNEWKKHGILMKLYLGNALYILTQMTDEQMISFTLKRVKASAVFLAAFPILLRKYIKVALHSWCTGRGVLPIVSFLLLRDLCVRLGSDCVDTCLKGMYKAYVMNCKLPKFASRPKLQHLQLLANCVTELYGLDLASSYQQAFVFIRQMAMVLQGALTKRGVKAGKDKAQGKQQEKKNSTKQHNDKVYQKVYDWQFINCLELWTGVICAYCSEADFRPLAYPLTQIIYGVSCLVPTARYFPLRLRCIKMLNRIARATGNFIPVSSLLLDMFDMKELNRTATGGIGKAVNFQAIKQVDKSTLNTRAFQEACIYSIVEELAEHLAQWSYSVAFFELSFIPLVRLRSFCKTTKIDRLRRETRELIRQVEANCEFTNSQRVGITFTPNDLATESFLKADKESGSGSLSKFAADLRLKAQQRDDSMVESSVIVGAKSSVFASKLPQSREDDSMDDDDDGAAVFSSSWLPEKKSKARTEKSKTLKKQHHDDVGGDEDIVEDLVLSSDDDDLAGEVPDASASKEEQHGSRRSKKKKPTTSQEKKNKKHKRDAVSSKKRKRPGFKNKARKVAS